ncbi:HD domain-containing protein [Dehalococcoidia bacterium]|nr:HD domain-containing protein [Dehalococcoidia bacterium]
MNELNQGSQNNFLDTIRSTLAPDLDNIYLVGGIVRDLVLGKQTNDIDIVTNADSLLTARILANRFRGDFYPLDAERYIGRALIRYGNQSWTIDVAPINGNLTDNLRKRDFSMNAMAMPLTNMSTNEIIDPHGGLRDITLKKIRSLSENVFVDDPIRLLRAIRLSGELNFTLENNTASLIRLHSELLKETAQERIRDEFVRILMLPSSLPSVRLMDETGILCTVIPELTSNKNIAQPKEHYWNVFDHNVETLGFAERIICSNTRKDNPILKQIPWKPNFSDHFKEDISPGHPRYIVFKLAALLHDIAKPATKTVEPDGRIRFIGHTTNGSKVVKQIMHRLRFSRREIELARVMVGQHLRPIQISQNWEKPSKRAIYRFFRDLDDAAIDTIILSFADHLAAVGPNLNNDEWQQHVHLAEATIDGGIEEEPVINSPRLITGHDLIKNLKMKPGPQLGRILEEVREAQFEGRITTPDEALTLATTLGNPEGRN